MTGKSNNCKERTLEYTLILNQVLGKDGEEEIELQTVFILIHKKYQDLILPYFGLSQLHYHGLHFPESQHLHHFSHQIPATVWV